MNWQRRLCDWIGGGRCVAQLANCLDGYQKNEQHHRRAKIRRLTSKPQCYGVAVFSWVLKLDKRFIYFMMGGLC